MKTRAGESECPWHHDWRAEKPTGAQSFGQYCAELWEEALGWLENRKAQVIAIGGVAACVGTFLLPLGLRRLGVAAAGAESRRAGLCEIAVLLGSVLIGTPYRRHKKIREWMRELMFPRLKIRCAPEVPECVTSIMRTELRPYPGPSARLIQDVTVVAPEDAPRTVTYEHTRIFRLRIETLGAKSALDCHIHLVRISLEGEPIWHGKACELPFDPEPASYDMHPGEARFAVVLEFEGRAEGVIKWPRELATPGTKRLFRKAGLYRLTVRITGRDMPVHEEELAFRWTGDWRTSELRLADPQAAPVPPLAPPE